MTPVRTCVGCRERTDPAEMLRVAKGPTGVAFGRDLPGRGAWVHRGCLEVALAKGRLARALRASLSETEIATLRDDFGRNGEP